MHRVMYDSSLVRGPVVVPKLVYKLVYGVKVNASGR